MSLIRVLSVLPDVFQRMFHPQTPVQPKPAPVVLQCHVEDWKKAAPIESKKK